MKIQKEQIDTEKLRANIEQYQMPFTAEYLRQKYNWNPIFSEIAVREYKRFMVLASIGKMQVTPSIDIDEVWHTHILHTRAYDIFSGLIGQKIHHEPGMPNAREDFQDQCRATLHLYREIFNEEPPRSVWPRRDDSGGSMRQVETLFLQS